MPSKDYFYLKHTAFTLAEVLITLGIIGIVAALTIPTIVTAYQKQQTVEKLKKTYTTISQAVKQSEMDNGSVDTWDWGTAPGADVLAKFKIYWAPYLRIMKYCATYTECNYKDNNYYGPSGNSGPLVDADSRTAVELADGSILTVASFGYGTSNPINSIRIDLNGAKGPNMLSIDIFGFVLASTKGFMPEDYNISSSSINSQCSTSGLGCSAKIIVLDNWQIKDDYPWK